MLPAGSERDSRYDQIKNISIQVFFNYAFNSFIIVFISAI